MAVQAFNAKETTTYPLDINHLISLAYFKENPVQIEQVYAKN